MFRRRQAVLDHDLPYLVAELEGYIVGFCYASQFRPREGYRYTVEDSIYVRPDCIGHGVGKALLAELISECQAKGCHSMVACICGVNVSSVALHASLGFQQVGLLPEAGRKFGEWLRLLIMQCPSAGSFDTAGIHRTLTACFRASAAVAPRRKTQVVATSSSSELSGGRRPSVLPAK